MYECKLCKVALCRVTLKSTPNAKSCFTKWHSCDNLTCERRKSIAALMASKRKDDKEVEEHDSDEEDSDESTDQSIAGACNNNGGVEETKEQFCVEKLRQF